MPALSQSGTCKLDLQSDWGVANCHQNKTLMPIQIFEANVCINSTPKVSTCLVHLVTAGYSLACGLIHLLTHTRCLLHALYTSVKKKKKKSHARYYQPHGTYQELETQEDHDFMTQLIDDMTRTQIRIWLDQKSPFLPLCQTAAR